MEDIQETNNKTVVALLKAILENLENISEYIEFKKKEELFKRQLTRYYPRGKLLPEKKDGCKSRVRISEEPK